MPLDSYKLLNSKELAEKWGLPESWIRNQVRKSCNDPIPHLKMGKYIKFEWPSRSLYLWYQRHRREGQPEAPAVRRVIRPQALKRKVGL